MSVPESRPARRGVDPLPAGKRDLNVFLPANGVIGRNDDAGPPVNSARWIMSASVNRHDVGLKLLHKLRQLVRETYQ